MKIPIEVLCELCGYAFAPWGNHSLYKAAPATESSVKCIENELSLTIPQDFVFLSQNCAAYGGWFDSIGEDYSSHIHILDENKSWHNKENQRESKR